MSAVRFLAADGLAPWLAHVAQSRLVLTPHKEGKSVVFRPFKGESDTDSTGGQSNEPVLLDKATLAPKAVLIPPCETLVRFTATKDPENPAAMHVTLNDAHEAAPTVLFGCRSCDARGFLALDHAYLGGKFKDVYYAARRAATLVVTRTCDAPGTTCFCTWVGGGPAHPAGSDVLLTAVEGGYVLEGVSAKGEAFLAEYSLSALPDGADKLAEAVAVREKAQASMPPAPDLKAAPQRLEARFTDMAFWEAHTAKCLSCGACTYMCPTCQCFSITDEGDTLDGRRLRSWDTCMSPLFTREASGHNPRAAKAARMRNRVSHKYWYAPGYNNGEFACTGCGRCIMHCPVSLDIREIVLKAMQEDSI